MFLLVSLSNVLRVYLPPSLPDTVKHGTNLLGLVAGRTDAPLYTWDFENQTAILYPSSSTSVPGADSTQRDPGLQDTPADTHDYTDNLVRPLRLLEDDWHPRITAKGDEVARTAVVDAGGGDTTGPPPLTLSLYARGSVRAIQTYLVTEEMDTYSYIFPCGKVVQGGLHFFR